MSAEPPPPDWVGSDAVFHHRRSILDGKDGRQARSSARVTLEPVPRASVLEGPEPEDTAGRDPYVEAQRAATVSVGGAWLSGVRQEWDDYAFTTLRRSQLVAFAGFVAVLALAAYGWQRGTLSGRTADGSGDLISAGGTPAAPRLSSDQVQWNSTWDGEGSDARRSTASFSSDRAVADGADDEPDSDAKLFSADGKRSSKGGATKGGDKPRTTESADDPLRNAATGSGSSDPSAADSTSRKRTETSVTTVRYEDCAEAAAAGAAPIRLGEPGYRLSLDRDKNGVACENGSTAEEPGDAPVDSLYSNPTTTTSDDSGSTTTVSSTGAGTTSTVDSTTTSRISTTGSTSTSSTSSTTDSSRSTSTTMSTTGSTSTTSTTAPSTSSSANPSSSTTASTTTSTTATSTTTSTTASTTTSSTPPTTVDPPPTDPVRAPATRRSGLGLI